MRDADELRATLEKLIEILRRHEETDEDVDDDRVPDDMPGCTIKSLPRRLWLKAAAKAVEINPVNAPSSAFGGEGFAPIEPLRLAVLTAKYWGPSPRRLTVSFMESTPSDLRRRIVSHMNAWNQRCGISFVETAGTGDVRISRGAGGFWSYLGTDIRLIPRDRPTMNLQGFTMDTSEREYRRVVRHETGHTMGFPHEHMRKAIVDLLDRQKTYDYFWETQRWDRPTVDAQVLTPLSEASLMGTPVDQTSIMCYQLPGRITKTGRPIPGGLDINATDFAFAARIYPRPGGAQLDVACGAAVGAGVHSSGDDDWSESEDPVD